ncbi:LPS-assembly protein LptD [Beggiatoa leptomitoformis]|uniref:LPS-assembly protein LptD n=1 Tax=Beggiatoa leptomitoformis TaxID=288004 RepID=A0A2N9YJB8_9GAMM|nr:LPS assembly protein LptD [Beggiatoa leptomitoformis]ALG69529.2 LPS assembly protein LptD [Beggiatoa leptomitoformis]AUI70574.2 LPS assembly protein LptD [Beggiatoa leptomitoformis]
MPKRHKLILFITLLITLPTNSHALEWGMCQAIAEITPLPPQLPPPPENNAVRLYADDGEMSEKEGKVTANGNVILQRGEQVLKTDLAIYLRDQETVDAEGNFTFWDKQFIVSGNRAKLLPNHQGEMHDVHYWLLNRRGRGQATFLQRESENNASLQQTTYTTCDPSAEVWRLDAANVHLNQETGRGTANNVFINVLNIPVFYSPYLSFPIDERRLSGFLAPSMGSSDEVGVEFSIPYYLNLAPNYDATITPRFMSKRGLLLGTEFRYLLANSGGKIEWEYLPSDRVADINRSLLKVRHSGMVVPSLYTDIVYDEVSDDLYFRELGDNLTVSSTTHLEQRGDLRYFGHGWNVLGRLQRYQSLDANPATRPYERLPQIILSSDVPERNKKINVQGQVELVNFERSYDEAPVGNRYDFKSTISFPWRTASGFFVPSAILRHTRYDLSQIPIAEADRFSETPTRSTYTLMADSGLFFDRELSLFNRNLLHTLEPRLFYRYTPYENQDDIPIFDTAEYDLSFGQLFRENRFIGADRVDDSNQLTAALTTRFIDQATGLENLRVSVGQIYYFADREVVLPSELFETNSSSNIVAEISSQFNSRLSGSATVLWNPYDSKAELSIWRLRYRPNPESLYNFAYRLRENRLEQTDVSWRFPLSSQWRTLGRWNYSLDEHKDLEVFLGLEYESCCWAMRGVARRYLNTVDGAYLNGFFFEVELKGLGGVGKKASAFLEDSIVGYDDRF